VKKALVPIIAVVVAVVLGISTFRISSNNTPPANPPGAPTSTPEADIAADATVGDTATPGPITEPNPDDPTPTDAPAAVAERPDAETGADPAADLAAASPAQAEPSAAAGGDAQPARELRVADAGEAENVTLGSTDPASGFDAEVRLTKWGAGLWEVRLAEYHATADGDEPYLLLAGPVTGSFAGNDYSAYPFAARSVVIDGAAVDLERVAWRAERVRRVEGIGTPATSVTYAATIVDADDEPVARVLRTWTLPRGGYDLSLDQRIVNLTGEPITARFSQYLMGDIVDDGPAYLGDRRMFVTGYFRPNNNTAVFTGSSGIFGSSGAGFRGRQDVIDSSLYAASQGQSAGVWPNPSLAAGSRLVWLAAENRYFSVIAHPTVDDPAAGLGGVTPLNELFPTISTHALPGPSVAPDGVEADRAVIFSGTTGALTVGPQGQAAVDLSTYAGPRDADIFEASEVFALLHFDNLVRYELGCTFCTFQWLAHGLLWYLEFIHGDVMLAWTGMPIGVWDWGIAIVILVITIRLLLHPITKRAQFNMMKMSKGMQAIQPEMEKLKKKYKDDSATLQKEMTKLYREKGVNPLGFLGCLPMFLQMPIWVALYAMLYYAIELRHEPAFYGVFQAISGGAWPFLGSLSEPDRFIPLSDSFGSFPLLFITLDFSAINILPILMGVVFYVNMKFTSPPPPENESDEQKQMRRQQQMVMKIMPFLMPFFLYSAPSGLTLYICASTGAGILDSYLVRKHIREQEEKGELFKKKERKPGGLMDRMGKYMESKQEQLAALQAQQESLKQKGGKGGGGKQRKKR